ncbi:aldose 1-epimerase [Petroclostridium sp. X23]|uniref:aldose 1-epimerase n=1 Tax=Petroclostridium sp. X23 TaxID=3045146 RepID=UPI0024AD65D8|nr:aldose 1-epimerase [Petroclostridium sp. X23]WHH60745.1 aldose 1-epimerase [Petroclostridium sp. X23]
MDYSSNRNYGCRILEFTHKNNRVLSMENEIIKINMLPDKGSDIYEMYYKPMDIDFMWKAPGGIRDVSKFIPTSSQFLGSHPDYYEGGWHECFPGGGPYNYKGAEIGLHGEIALMPWQYSIEEDNENKITVSLSCETYRFPFKVNKKITMHSKSPVIEFEETIINDSDEEIQYMWGHHPVFGKPFLDGNCRIDIPAKEFSVCKDFNVETSLFESGYSGRWPKAKGKDNETIDLSLVPSGEKPTADLFFLKGLEEGWFAVTNTKLKLGIGFVWDASLFPYVWYWQVANGLSGFPWYGRTYNIGLEFWTSIPNSFDKAVENGTIDTFKGKESKNTKYSVIIYNGLEKVNHLGIEGTVK